MTVPRRWCSAEPPDEPPENSFVDTRCRDAFASQPDAESLSGLQVSTCAESRVTGVLEARSRNPRREAPECQRSSTSA